MAKKKKNFKNITGDVVYSTNQDYDYDYSAQEEDTLNPVDQDLRVWLDKKHRGGKVASVIKGFVGSADDLKDLAKIIKSKCGVGGSAKDGEIIIQGDHREKIIGILNDKGYKSKKAGG
ncbi:MAG: translation initiation factor [Bacteroidetes bacterium 4572_77]|nr:MAG: translation initiation factor [Bacteroidetes bacterium 4572_77]